LQNTPPFSKPNRITIKIVVQKLFF
jgi:hypothetical protein